jgi:hypothetical protein
MRGRHLVPVKRRFWEKVDMSMQKGNLCWIWTGAVNARGYGRVKNGMGQNDYAHRLAWQLRFGKIAPGLVILHSCDTPDCVNPEHLVAAPQSANLVDAQDKGRRPISRKAIT